jgi:hypothetical protein
MPCFLLNNLAFGDGSVGCECGVGVSKGPFGHGLEDHMNTEKHANMLALKQRDPESWRLALNPKTAQVKCACGKMVCRWTMFRHEQTPSHIKTVSKKKVR